MKTKTCIFTILLAGGLSNSHAQDTWTQKADVGGAPRASAVGFSIGSKGYIGTGSDFITTNYNDFWEYEPASNSWTQKADFGGTIRGHAASFAIGDKGYVGTGQSNPNSGTVTKDLWEFDPIANTWLRKANFGGTAREFATGISTGSKGYIGLGWDGSE